MLLVYIFRKSYWSKSSSASFNLINLSSGVSETTTYLLVIHLYQLSQLVDYLSSLNDKRMKINNSNKYISW